jgi:hypothetical protein
MPGDPKEARVHAANCMKLAGTASSPTLQKTFLDLANQWKRLANELDDAYALLKALNELDLKTASTSPNDGDLLASMPTDQAPTLVQ